MVCLSVSSFACNNEFVVKSCTLYNTAKLNDGDLNGIQSVIDTLKWTDGAVIGVVKSVSAS